MFDHTTIELLSGNADYGDMTHNCLPTGQIDQTSIFGANSVNHYDAGLHYDGQDRISGNSVLHHDAANHLNGYSRMVGGELITYNSSGAIIGRDSFSSGFTIHRNAEGAIIGKTDAFGKDYDATGKLIGRRGK